MGDTVDSYLTIARESEIETKVKGSRFIGRAFCTDTREQAEHTLADIRKAEYDATHHCFAYIIQPETSEEVASNPQDRNIFRYSDDGEPSGSAGKPIYDQILGRNLVNALVVVTRYFGGTKLGVGGLVRAYSESASLALDSAGAQRKYQYRQFLLRTDFSHYQPVIQLVHKLAGLVDDSQFSDAVEMTVSIRLSHVDTFAREFTELTHGKGALTEMKE